MNYYLFLIVFPWLTLLQPCRALCHCSYHIKHVFPSGPLHCFFLCQELTSSRQQHYLFPDFFRPLHKFHPIKEIFFDHFISNSSHLSHSGKAYSIYSALFFSICWNIRWRKFILVHLFNSSPWKLNFLKVGTLFTAVPQHLEQNLAHHSQ